jgi:hypothetical protein
MLVRTVDTHATASVHTLHRAARGLCRLCWPAGAGGCDCLRGSRGRVLRAWCSLARKIDGPHRRSSHDGGSVFAPTPTMAEPGAEAAREAVPVDP